MVTVKELAKQCGVSPQSIRNYCIKHNVPKQAQDNNKLVFCIDKDTETAIIRYYKEKEESTSTTQEVHKTSTSKHIVDLLQKQLEVKDKQLQEQQKTIHDLTESNKQQAETIKQLSEQLTAAQQIQAGTVKALLTEQTKQEQETDAVTVPETKQGFFSRLFRRKK